MRTGGWGVAGEIVFWLGVAAGLYACSRYDYLLFHSIAEMFSIAVGWSIFIVAWNARKVTENDFLLFLGIGFLFIGVVDLLHTLSYKGMNVFPGYDANLPTQLWVAWQYLLALAFLVAPGFIRHEMKTSVALGGFAAITAALVASIFGGVFPDCFIEGVGLTRFKKASEILTAVMLLASAGLMWRCRNRFSPKVLKLLVAAVLVAVCAKTAFIFYVSVYGFSNLVGHYLMTISFLLIYKAIVETGISTPSEILFRELKTRETELKATGKALAAATDRLEQQVAVRTRALERINRRLKKEVQARKEAQELLFRRNLDLEEINRELDDFAYMVSHDLREPLRGMFNYAGMLMEDYSGRLDGDGRVMLENMAKLAKRQEAQIAAILRYSRIGRKQPDMSWTDMDGLVREVLEILGPSLEACRTTVRVFGPLPAVRCDRELMAEVFQNLIVNAMKYNDKSEKRVEIGCHDTRRWAQAVFFPEAGGAIGGIVFFIRDNGIGIERKHYENIFKIFKRLHGRNAYGGGTGAGLTIARKIIDYHGGRIWLSSVPDQGTCFFSRFQVGERKIPPAS